MSLLLRRFLTPIRSLFAILLSVLILVNTILPVSLFANGLSTAELSQLRDEVTELFYHGFDNYMNHAFPEDELRPLSCLPLTRDRENPSHMEHNDVLGNYSLTLVDSLSTLALLASAPSANRDPWGDFQRGVESLVELYGDGSDTPARIGKRATGFDLDSKVQVFETVIRGVGGLVSAHLFAIGELPVKGYTPSWEYVDGRQRTTWPTEFVYDGQLLRLATDLAERLLPAFTSPTGLPYPRVNLRTGMSSHNKNRRRPSSFDRLGTEGIEITETCSAGAGSLILEFSTLSRLTGDPRFETAAKKAFWAVWQRRSSIDLIGSGIDAETGMWTSPYTGIGAGIDSFFEYAFKSYVLLSGDDPTGFAVNESVSADYLLVFEDSVKAINRHLFRRHSHRHPYYVQGDLNTGAVRAFWVDSLSAFYPGLLALAGDVDQAIESHLLFAALWTRYSAIPERWSTTSQSPEGGLHWWGGRPEFIESNWYLYRATKDPWFLSVGSMVLEDIRRRCWVKCGLAGLQNVMTGQRSDRMESFFLSETAMYLFLLFTPNHPIHSLDRPFVFSTEGHPLIIPKVHRRTKVPVHDSVRRFSRAFPPRTCPAPPPPNPFSSSILSREDFFHASELARLELASPSQPRTSTSLRLSLAGVESPNNFSLYPWTVPLSLLPTSGICSDFSFSKVTDLNFPRLSRSASDFRLSKRVDGGILISPAGGFRMTMLRHIQDGREMFQVESVSSMMLRDGESAFLPHQVVTGLDPTEPHFHGDRDPVNLDLVLDISSEGPKPVSKPDDGRFLYHSRSTKPQPGPRVGLGDMSGPVRGRYRDSGSGPRPGPDDSMFSSILERIRTFFPAVSSLHELLSPNRLHRVTVPARFAPSNDLTQASVLNNDTSATFEIGEDGTFLGQVDRDEDLLDELSRENDSVFPYFSSLPLQKICTFTAPPSGPTNAKLWSSSSSGSHLPSGCVDTVSAEMAASCQALIVKIPDPTVCSPGKQLSLIPLVARTDESVRLVVMVYPNSTHHDHLDRHHHHHPFDPPATGVHDTGNGGGDDDDILAQLGLRSILTPRPLSVVVLDNESDQTWRLLQAAEGIGIRRQWRYWSAGVPISNLVVV